MTCLIKPALVAIIAMMSTSAFATPVQVILETNQGTIEIEVYVDKAPLSAAGFLSYIDNGLFEEGGAFYRAVRRDNDTRSPQIEVIQGGLLDMSKSLPPIAHETTDQTGVLHKDGVVSLARDGVGTASGAVFFICIGDQPALDMGGGRMADGYGTAAFGKVIKGMEIVRKIQNMKTVGDPQRPWFGEQLIESPVHINKALRTR